MTAIVARSFVSGGLLAAALGMAFVSGADAQEGVRSSGSARVAGVDVTVTVEGSHLTARAVPATPTLTAVAFPGRSNRGVTLSPQSDRALMAMLPHTPSEELAVIVAAADAHGTVQEACVMPIDHAATCRLESHAIHVHLITGHDYQIDRQPPQ